MYAAMATSWNLLGGYAGYLSLGHAAFFGVGAYAEAIMFTHIGIGSGYRPFEVLPLVGLGVALLSVPVGLIALRVRAATFAIVTISLLFIVQQLAFNLHSLTNGAQGMSMPLPPFPVETYERPFYFSMVGVYIAAVLMCWAAAGGKLGLMLGAIRDDEDRARGLGVRTTYAKTVAFAASAGVIGMAGGIWAYYEGFIYPQFAVDPLVTIGMVLMTFLGGRGTMWGPTLGAVILVPTQQYLAYSQGTSNLYLLGLLGGLPGDHAADAARDHPVGARPGDCPLAVPGAAGRADFRGARGGQVSAAARGPGHDQAVRRCGGAGRLFDRGGRGHRDRADRAQRLGQDDPLQPDHRIPAGRRRDAGLRRPRRSAGPSLPGSTGWGCAAPSSRPGCSPT